MYFRMLGGTTAVLAEPGFARHGNKLCVRFERPLPNHPQEYSVAANRVPVEPCFDLLQLGASGTNHDPLLLDRGNRTEMERLRRHSLELLSDTQFELRERGEVLSDHRFILNEADDGLVFAPGIDRSESIVVAVRVQGFSAPPRAKGSASVQLLRAAFGLIADDNFAAEFLMVLPVSGTLEIGVPSAKFSYHLRARPEGKIDFSTPLLAALSA